MLLCWSRDDLFAFSRFRCELDQSLRETVSQLGLRRRGRRAGRRQPAAAGVVTSPPPASNVNNNKRSADGAADTLVPSSTAVQHQPQIPSFPIPTVNGRRTLSKNNGQRDVRKRVLISVKRNSPTAQQRIDQLIPSLYVLNAAALSKPYAIDHLTVDLSSNNTDVAVITETHLKTKHTNSVVAIDGYRVYRRDRAGRRGGGVALYVRSTLQSTVWTHSADDRTYELQWVRVGDVFVAALYHPPRPLYKPEALLTKVVKRLPVNR